MSEETKLPSPPPSENKAPDNLPSPTETPPTCHVDTASPKGETSVASPPVYNTEEFAAPKNDNTELMHSEKPKKESS